MQKKMTYVKFTGRTPYQCTEYEDYLAFSEDEIGDAKNFMIKQSVNFAIENAQLHDDLLTLKGDAHERNAMYLDYLQACISNAHFEIISEREFDLGIERLQC